MTAVAEHFWRNVIRGPDCWGWRGPFTKKDRRARVRWQVDGVRRFAYAARVSWELHVGSVPDGLCVCHRCDNPECTNPAHLFLGSQLDNIRDRSAKGRSWRPIGSAHPRARLDEDDVRVIRVLLENHAATQYELAALYGVHRSTIKDIQHRRSWGHVT